MPNVSFARCIGADVPSIVNNRDPRQTANPRPRLPSMRVRAPATAPPERSATATATDDDAKPYSALSSSVISLTEDFASPNSIAVFSP
jgi:hypothetical protein